MPSIFSSWRPSKLQVRLRKLSHQLGGGNAAVMGYHSSDEDDDEGGNIGGLHGDKDSFTVRKHNSQQQQKMGNSMIDNDFIVEASPSQRNDVNRIPPLPPTSSQQRNNPQAVSNYHYQQSSLSDDEYFIRSPAISRAAATANRHFPVTSPRFRMDEANAGANGGVLNRLPNGQQSISNNNNSLESSSSNSSSRRRAVRFSEENDVRNIRQQQPPICNVAPTTASQSNEANLRTIASNNGHISSEDETQSSSLPASLQVRALTSPIPTNAAALPPKYSPSPVLKLSGLYDNSPAPASAKPVRHTVTNNTAPTTLINPNGPSTWQKGFSSMMMVENNSETEMTANESDENSQAPPRPARTGLMGRNGAKNRANILLQQLRSGGGSNADADGMLNTVREQPNLAAATPIHPYPQQQQPRLGITTTSTSPVMTSGGVLFLEYNEEVKRIPFPSIIHSFQQVKSLFLKTFPDLTLEYLNLPFVKIYIQESTKSQIFYELDDLKDIKDRTLLKIRQHKQPVQPSSQQRPGFQSPPPSRFNHNQPLATVLPSGGVDYFSEPELDYGASRQQQPRYDHHHYESGRASASNGMLYGPQYPQQQQQRNNQHSYGGRLRTATPDYGHTLQPDDALTSSGTSTLRGGGGDDLSTTASASYDPYYELYCSGSGSSDTASRHSRSGSSTPIIFNQQGQQQQDAEARQRMDAMEHQLANLSTLVHSAMISREMNPLLRREMMDLQRQILDLQTPSSLSPNKLGNANELMDGHGGRTSAGIGKPIVNGVAPLVGKRNAAILQRIRNEAQSTHDELRQLRRIAQMNAKTAQDLLRSAFQKVCIHLRNMDLSHQKDPLLARSGTILPQTKLETLTESELEKCRKTHLDRMAGLLNALRAFEFSVEDIRSSVLNSNRKLRMVEVEQLTNSLTEIGKNAAELKTKFPELQTQLEEEIRENMENIVREENFIKEESQQVDECLRRCKNLANMMITMKKLAMVQDPTLKNLKSAQSSKSSTTGGELIVPMTKAEIQKKSLIQNAPKLTGVATTIQANPPTDKNNNNNQSSPTKTKPDALDNILDELNFSPAKLKIVGSDKAEKRFTLTAAVKTPPKPPERRRYNTTEVRMLYERENNDFPPQKLRTATSSFEIGSRRGADNN